VPDYFTLAEFRLLPNVSSEAKYPDDVVEAAADWAEGVIEAECGTSFTLRAHTEITDGTGNSDIILSWPFVAAITSVTVDGVGLSGPELAALSFFEGILRRPIGSTWSYGRANITVVYTAGYSAVPPADIKGAAMQATSYRLRTFYGDKGHSERATSVSNEMGTTSLAIADENHPTGLPEVDAAITRWKRLSVFGFA
jgi:hypothetical protein